MRKILLALAAFSIGGCVSNDSGYGYGYGGTYCDYNKCAGPQGLSFGAQRHPYRYFGHRPGYGTRQGFNRGSQLLDQNPRGSSGPGSPTGFDGDQTLDQPDRSPDTRPSREEGLGRSRQTLDQGRSQRTPRGGGVPARCQVWPGCR